MEDVYVIVRHDRHTDDSYIVAIGHDRALKLASDLAKKECWVDDEGNPLTCGYGVYGLGEDYYIDVVKSRLIQ